MTHNESTLPVEGSITWAIAHGQCFHVEGIYKYGQLTTRAETHQTAAQAVLYRSDSYCVWVPSGTVLEVWRVVGGSIGGFHMQDPWRFVVRRGEVFPLS